MASKEVPRRVGSVANMTGSCNRRLLWNRGCVFPFLCSLSLLWAASLSNRFRVPGLRGRSATYTPMTPLVSSTTVANFAWTRNDYEVLVDIDELEKSIRKMLMGAKVSGGCYATT